MPTRLTKLDIIDYLLSSPSSSPSPFYHPLLTPSFTDLDLALNRFNPIFPPSLPDVNDDVTTTITDLIHIHHTTPFTTTTTNLITRRYPSSSSSSYHHLKSLSDRVAALELAFEEKPKKKNSNNKSLEKKKKNGVVDRKYTWTAEINSKEKDGVDRKYKVTTEIKGGKKKEEEQRRSKWTAEIKRKGGDDDEVKKYSFTASSGVEDESSSDEEENNNKKKDKKEKKKKDKKKGGARIVEIQGSPDHGTLLLKQAFAKRASLRNKGKKKELSPQDAAMLIQMTFRAYLIRRSQALRALRELAIAKGKLKELRALFNNFSYRRRVARDAEEKQKFSEKIIVLLLTVDAIEGADIMVRAAKRSMVDELEAMLDVIDPQPGGRGQGHSLSLKRRTFDMPDSVIQKEVAEGVAQVVRMLGQDNGSETFEVYE